MLKLPEYNLVYELCMFTNGSDLCLGTYKVSQRSKEKKYQPYCLEFPTKKFLQRHAWCLSLALPAVYVFYEKFDHH